ncbi:hypothetical protein H311_04157 [Anncaliia algerae PRA109]|nr:hypothetical protein H311_04157 [Anncaliia algerae PRA109]
MKVLRILFVTLICSVGCSSYSGVFLNYYSKFIGNVKNASSMLSKECFKQWSSIHNFYKEKKDSFIDPKIKQLKERFFGVKEEPKEVVKEETPKDEEKTLEEDNKGEEKMDEQEMLKMLQEFLSMYNLNADDFGDSIEESETKEGNENEDIAEVNEEIEEKKDAVTEGIDSQPKEKEEL